LANNSIGTKSNISDSIIARAVDSAVNAIALVNLEGKIIYVNASFLNMLGYENIDEVLGQPITALLQASEGTKELNNVLERKENWVGELTLKKNRGSPFFVELFANPVIDELGEIPCIIISFLDVTERKKIEQALKENVIFTASLLDNYQHPIVVLNPDTTIRYVNPAVEALTGFAAEELTGLKPPYPWLTPESLPQTERDFKIAINRGKTWFEEQYRKKNGELFWAEITSVPVKRNGTTEYCMTIWVDITERKQMENQLKREKERAETYLNIIVVMVSLIDTSGKITMINQRGCALLGYEQEELLNKNWFNLLLPGKSRRKVRSDLRNLITGKVDSLDHYESSLITKSGQEKRISSDYIPVKDTTGVVTGILITSEDITETRKAHEQIQHTRLMVSLGEMTAGIAHEVNNPLGSILLYSELIMASDVPPALKKDLKIIHDEAKRATKIMTDLLIYGRRAKPHMRRVNLHYLLDKALGMRRYQQRLKNITVYTDYSAEPLYTVGDSMQLVQVFMNIILNAEEALNQTENRKISIKTRADSKWAKVIIADNGSGIPVENLNQIFYPFFTTKPTGEGTGLGLSTSYGIVTEHKGLIHAENNEEGGATFIVELPLAPNKRNKERRKNTNKGKPSNAG
jgi:PAS domain S-box-containing protein